MTDLYTSVSATFIDDGNGGSIATAILGPTVYGHSWIVTSMVTSTTSADTTLGTTELRVYQGYVNPSSLRASSWTADNDQFGGERIELRTLENLVFEWKNGQVGSIATAVVRGEIQDVRRR